ncbi:Brain-derived neurotrophic factor [Halotydeus destructor]|nr:Brain-derived neurotrophic factor [Halotydeus destructor]
MFMLCCYLQLTHCSANNLVKHDNQMSEQSAPRLIRKRTPTGGSFDLQHFADIAKLPVRVGLVRFAESKPTRALDETGRAKRGRPKTHHATELVQDVCPSVSDWVAKSEAYDPYGNSVTIVQRIPINGTVVNQYFYETFCASNYKYELDDLFGTTYRRVTDATSLQCRGVDKAEWNSRCRENYIWTYGKVMSISGETGWSVIAVRGSCGCAIWPKRPETRSASSTSGRRRRVSKNNNANNNNVDNNEMNIINDEPYYR